MVRAIPQNLKQLSSSAIAQTAFDRNLSPTELRRRGVTEQQLIEVRTEMQRIKQQTQPSQQVQQAQQLSLQSRIQSIENQIRLSNIEEAREIRTKDKAGRNQERARQLALKEGLVRLRKGELLTVKSIIEFADAKGNQARRGKLARQRKAKIKQPKLMTLEGTETVTTKGKVVIKKKPQLKVTKRKLTAKDLIRISKPLASFEDPKLLNRFTKEESTILKQLPKKKERFTKQSLNTLENLRLKAIRGNRNAKAALLGIASLPFAVTEFGIETVLGIASLLKNPVAVALLAAQLTRQDISNAGARFGARIQAGEPKALVDLVASVSPLKIPKVPKFIAKLVAESSQIQSATSTFKVTQNVLKGSGTIKIITKGITQGNDIFKSIISLTLRPRDKIIFGTVTTTIGKKTKVRNIVLKDKGAFYEDVKTGIKIPKTSRALDSVQVNVTRQKTTITDKFGRITATTLGTITQGKKVAKKTKIVVTPKVKAEVTIKTFNKFDKFIGTRDGKKFRDFRENSKLVQSIKSISRKNTASRTTGDWNKLTKFLEFHNFDKAIINGFDRRTWMALMLGLNKKSANTLIKNFEQDILQGYVIKRGKLTATGSFETINPTRFALGPSFVLSKPSVIGKLKKGKKGINTPQQIKIPDINALIVMPSRLSKGVKIPLSLFRVAALNGVADQYQFENLTKTKKAEQLKKIIPIKVPAVKKIPKQIVKQVPKQKVKVITKTKAKQVLKKKIPVKKIVKVSRPKVVVRKIIKPKKVIRLPKIGLTFNTKLKKGTRLGFDVFFRSKGKVRRLNVKLPMGQALNKLSKLIDNTTSRSAEIRIVGTTKVKDVKLSKNIKKKFRLRKTKKVLKLVEKRKFGIDTRGEKRGLTIAKAIKKRTRKKSKKSKKVVKKKSQPKKVKKKK